MASSKKSPGKQKNQNQTGSRPLTKLGEFIRESRLKAGFETQDALAKALGRHQSYVAQLETGKITNPDVQECRDLAAALKPAGVTLYKLESVLLEDKREMPPAKARLVRLDVLDLDGLAEWEAEIKPDALWIVAPNFVDTEHVKMRRSVVGNLKAGAEIVYFVAEADCQAFGRFTMLHRKLKVELGPGDWEKKLKHHALTDRELCWLASSFVIANPGTILGDPKSKKKSEGFIILNEYPEHAAEVGEGQLPVPAFGFRMPEKELQLRAIGIETYLQEKEQQQRERRERDKRDGPEERKLETIDRKAPA